MKQYDIWMARVRFEDSADIKQRPVLIIGNAAFVIAYKMTGTDRGDSEDEYRVRYWQEAGLTKPTSIRISKVLKLLDKDMVEKIGELDERDRLMFEIRLSALR